MSSVRVVLAAVAVLGVASCVRTAAPEALPAPDRVEKKPRDVVDRKAPPVASAPRPDVDISHLIPDFHDALRWPLSAMSHPSLEPRFNIAQVFAEPGLDWLELCERGFDKRTSPRQRDEMHYLRGWCAAMRGEVDGALDALRQVVSSPVLGLSAAIPFDVANILAANGDASKAEGWLKRHALARPEILDILAATYAEIGSEGDAWEVNRIAIDTAVNPRAESHCRRLVRRIVLGPAGDRELPMQALADLATKPRIPVQACVDMHEDIRCWSEPATACGISLYRRQFDGSHSALLAAYVGWPRGAAGPARWLSVANAAAPALHLPAGFELFFTAVHAAIAAEGSCSTQTFIVVDQAVQRLRVWNQTLPIDKQSLYTRCLHRR